MLLWLIFALLTAAVLIAVLAPLARPAAATGEADSGALEVYRHQLAELEADRARGLVEGAEADAARVEISRRLLASAAAPKAGTKAPAAVPGDRTPLAIAAAVLVTLSSLGIYLVYGAPDMPAFPAAERGAGPLADAPLGQMIAKVEARLRAEPRDGDGWAVIAPVYFKLGRYKDAANAYAHAAEIKGETVERLAGFADSTVRAADGIVTDVTFLCANVCTFYATCLRTHIIKHMIIGVCLPSLGINESPINSYISMCKRLHVLCNLLAYTHHKAHDYRRLLAVIGNQ